MQVGTIACIAKGDIEDGTIGVLATTGVHRLAKKTGEAMAQGAAVQWVSADSEVAAAGNFDLGVVWTAAGTADEWVEVRLNNAAASNP